MLIEYVVYFFLAQTLLYFLAGEIGWKTYLRRTYVKNEQLIRDLISGCPEWTQPLLRRELERADWNEHVKRKQGKIYCRTFITASIMYVITMFSALALLVVDVVKSV